MMPEICLGSLLLFLGMMFSDVADAFVGINIGTAVSTMPPASEVVALLKSNEITHVRLFNADAKMLSALAGTGIEVMVSATNEEVLGIGLSPSTAAAWVNQNVAAYLPSTNITAIAVGSEVLTAIPNAAPILVPAMNYLQKALVAANLNSQVKVSTPQSMDLLSKPSFPPSTASFNTTWNSTIFQLLQFLRNTNSFYMLNAYPYYGYINSNGIFPIEYALFQELPVVKEIVDPNTLYNYDSMLDGMVDAMYNAIAAYNFSGIPIVVTESGWPSFGGPNEPDATTENAKIYNNNLVLRALNGSGPPSQPAIPINTYIFELFNEDNKTGPISKRNLGLYFSNGTAVYPVRLNTSETISGNATVFCVAIKGANATAMKNGLNYACWDGGANCSAIQPGQPCYEPDTLQNHASFAYNDYYQRMLSLGGTCDFDGTATLTNVDPSYGSCIFTGSSNSSSGAVFSPTTGFGPTAQPGGDLGRASGLQIPGILAILIGTSLLGLYQVA